VRQLSGLGYLQPVPDGKGGLQLGPPELVRPLLRGETRLELPLPPPRQERRRRGRSAGGGSSGPGLPQTAEGDQQLLQALKTWRREQAQQQGVPPYVVFHDRTLLELAASKPRDLEGLSQVGGIGAAKLERYGEAVLAVLQQWP
jgi:ATP-dependent DNA helicase RecQ